MRVVVLASRGVWLTGGGGLILAAAVFTLARFLALVILAGLCIAVAMALALMREQLRSTRAARISLLAHALDGCVEQDSDAQLAGVPPVWAVYAMGRSFHYGRYPSKGDALARLFQDRVASIARVAVFPDRERASRAASLLNVHGFSFEELRRLFPTNYRAACKAPSESGRNGGMKEVMHG